jgi:hypothetical protein
MESTDLFSHPDKPEPEVVRNAEASSVAVQIPAFSDHPRSDSPASPE